MYIKYLVVDYAANGLFRFAYYPQLPQSYLREITHLPDSDYLAITDFLYESGFIPEDRGHLTRNTSFSRVRNTPLDMSSFLKLFRGAYVSVFSSNPMVQETPYPKRFI